MAATTSSIPLSLCNYSLSLSPPKLSFSLSHHQQLKSLKISPNFLQTRRQTIIIPCSATRNSPNYNISTKKTQSVAEENEDDTFRRKLTQSAVWVMAGFYISWLYFLPFAPGDPVWAMSSESINSLGGLALNFFFILPIINLAGIHVMEAPVLHPMYEGVFNFIMGWSVMFAPLLYTDFRNGRFKGSLDVLWGVQMFVTNTFFIPYMAIRLNDAETIDDYPKKPSGLGTLMIRGAPIVGLVGAIVCAMSFPWALFGRMDGDFGSVSDRWNFWLSYVGYERGAYTFIWDIVLYTIFQPWLIGGNLENVAENRTAFVSRVRYIPVVGLLAYLLYLKRGEFVEQPE